MKWINYSFFGSISGKVLLCCFVLLPLSIFAATPSASTAALTPAQSQTIILNQLQSNMTFLQQYEFQNSAEYNSLEAAFSQGTTPACQPGTGPGTATSSTTSTPCQPYYAYQQNNLVPALQQLATLINTYGSSYDWSDVISWVIANNGANASDANNVIQSFANLLAFAKNNTANFTVSDAFTLFNNNKPSATFVDILNNAVGSKTKPGLIVTINNFLQQNQSLIQVYDKAYPGTQTLEQQLQTFVTNERFDGNAAQVFTNLNTALAAINANVTNSSLAASTRISLLHYAMTHLNEGNLDTDLTNYTAALNIYKTLLASPVPIGNAVTANSTLATQWPQQLQQALKLSTENVNNAPAILNAVQNYYNFMKYLNKQTTSGNQLFALIWKDMNCATSGKSNIDCIRQNPLYAGLQPENLIKMIWANPNNPNLATLVTQYQAAVTKVYDLDRGIYSFFNDGYSTDYSYSLNKNGHIVVYTILNAFPENGNAMGSIISGIKFLYDYLPPSWPFHIPSFWSKKRDHTLIHQAAFTKNFTTIFLNNLLAKKYTFNQIESSLNSMTTFITSMWKVGYFDIYSEGLNYQNGDYMNEAYRGPVFLNSNSSYAKSILAQTSTSAPQAFATMYNFAYYLMMQEPGNADQFQKTFETLVTINTSLKQYNNPTLTDFQAYIVNWILQNKSNPQLGALTEYYANTVTAIEKYFYNDSSTTTLTAAQQAVLDKAIANAKTSIANGANIIQSASLLLNAPTNTVASAIAALPKDYQTLASALQTAISNLQQSNIDNPYLPQITSNFILAIQDFTQLANMSNPTQFKNKITVGSISFANWQQFLTQILTLVKTSPDNALNIINAAKALPAAMSTLDGIQTNAFNVSDIKQEIFNYIFQNPGASDINSTVTAISQSAVALSKLNQNSVVFKALLNGLQTHPASASTIAAIANNIAPFLQAIQNLNSSNDFNSTFGNNVYTNKLNSVVVNMINNAIDNPNTNINWASVFNSSDTSIPCTSNNMACVQSTIAALIGSAQSTAGGGYGIPGYGPTGPTPAASSMLSLAEAALQSPSNITAINQALNLVSPFITNIYSPLQSYSYGTSFIGSKRASKANCDPFSNDYGANACYLTLAPSWSTNLVTYLTQNINNPDIATITQNYVSAMTKALSALNTDTEKWETKSGMPQQTLTVKLISDNPGNAQAILQAAPTIYALQQSLATDKILGKAYPDLLQSFNTYLSNNINNTNLASLMENYQTGINVLMQFANTDVAKKIQALDNGSYWQQLQSLLENAIVNNPGDAYAFSQGISALSKTLLQLKSYTNSTKQQGIWFPPTLLTPLISMLKNNVNNPDISNIYQNFLSDVALVDQTETKFHAISSAQAQQFWTIIASSLANKNISVTFQSINQSLTNINNNLNSGIAQANLMTNLINFTDGNKSNADFYGLMTQYQWLNNEAIASNNNPTLFQAYSNLLNTISTTPTTFGELSALKTIIENQANNPNLSSILSAISNNWFSINTSQLQVINDLISTHPTWTGQQVVQISYSLLPSTLLTLLNPVITEPIATYSNTNSTAYQTALKTYQLASSNAETNVKTLLLLMLPASQAQQVLQNAEAQNPPVWQKLNQALISAYIVKTNQGNTLKANGMQFNSMANINNLARILNQNAGVTTIGGITDLSNLLVSMGASNLSSSLNFLSNSMLFNEMEAGNKNITCSQTTGACALENGTNIEQAISLPFTEQDINRFTLANLSLSNPEQLISILSSLPGINSRIKGIISQMIYDKVVPLSYMDTFYASLATYGQFALGESAGNKQISTNQDSAYELALLNTLAARLPGAANKGWQDIANGPFNVISQTDNGGSGRGFYDEGDINFDSEYYGDIADMNSQLLPKGSNLNALVDNFVKNQYTTMQECSLHNKVLCEMFDFAQNIFNSLKGSVKEILKGGSFKSVFEGSVKFGGTMLRIFNMATNPIGFAMYLSGSSILNAYDTNEISKLEIQNVTSMFDMSGLMMRGLVQGISYDCTASSIKECAEAVSGKTLVLNMIWQQQLKNTGAVFTGSNNKAEEIVHLQNFILSTVGSIVTGGEAALDIIATNEAGGAIALEQSQIDSLEADALSSEAASKNLQTELQGFKSELTDDADTLTPEQRESLEQKIKAFESTIKSQSEKYKEIIASIEDKKSRQESVGTVLRTFEKSYDTILGIQGAIASINIAPQQKGGGNTPINVPTNTQQTNQQQSTSNKVVAPVQKKAAKTTTIPAKTAQDKTITINAKTKSNTANAPLPNTNMRDDIVQSQSSLDEDDDD